MQDSPQSSAPSWRRTWLLPLLMIAGRRLWVYVALYGLHLALAGLALATIANKAGTGDDDAAFWLSFGWIALQLIASPRLFVPTALALAFVALQATSGDRDAIFWICFSWLALGVLRGGILMRITRSLRRRARERAQAEAGPGFESIFASFVGGGFSPSGSPGSGHDRGSPAAGPSAEAADTIDGTAREIDTDLVDELERLAALHASRAITDAEYEAAKRALLDRD
jgi:hypothetical protein